MYISTYLPNVVIKVLQVRREAVEVKHEIFDKHAVLRHQRREVHLVLFTVESNGYEGMCELEERMHGLHI